ncbi:MAG: hypothetical protein ABSH49_16165 [Bryobacteraceae bacterium]
MHLKIPFQFDRAPGTFLLLPFVFLLPRLQIRELSRKGVANASPVRGCRWGAGHRASRLSSHGRKVMPSRGR